MNWTWPYWTNQARGIGTFLLEHLWENGSRPKDYPTHITYYDQIIAITKLKCLQKVPKIKRAEELKQILKWSRQEKLVAYIAELYAYH